MSNVISLLFFNIKCHSHRLLFGIIFGISVMSIAVLNLIWNSYCRVNIRNSDLLRRILYRRYLQTNPSPYVDCQSNISNEYTNEDKKVDVDLEEDKYKAALDASIYADLQRLMNEEKIYRNPNLSRDEVVARLGTSKKTFLEVLQRNINMNFIDYINTYRLSDAINLLQKSEYTNETIAAEVGFGSVNTFYRQFRSRYGISPSEYKKSFLLKSIKHKSHLIAKI